MGRYTFRLTRLFRAPSNLPLNPGLRVGVSTTSLGNLLQHLIPFIIREEKNILTLPSRTDEKQSLREGNKLSCNVLTFALLYLWRWNISQGPDLAKTSCLEKNHLSKWNCLNCTVQPLHCGQNGQKGHSRNTQGIFFSLVSTRSFSTLVLGANDWCGKVMLLLNSESATHSNKLN